MAAVFFTVTVLLVFSPIYSWAENYSADSFEKHLIDTFGNNVFTVSAYTRNVTDQNQTAVDNGNDNWCRRIGTAYLFDGNGHLVTFHSVVDDAVKIHVHSRNRKKLSARVLEGHLPAKITVIAVGRKNIAKIPHKLPFRDVRPGMDVAFLSMVNSELSVVHGNVKDIIIPDGTIIIDVAGDPGTSGTPVFDRESNLVGFLAYQISPESQTPEPKNSTKEYSYVVIPAESACIIAHSIVNCIDGNCGWLGIASSVNDTYKNSEGIIIKHVIDGSPADKIGLMVDDCIFEFNGKPIDSPVHLIEEISSTSAGETVSVKFKRAGRIISEWVTLSKYPRK